MRSFQNDRGMNVIRTAKTKSVAETCLGYMRGRRRVRPSDRASYQIAFPAIVLRTAKTQKPRTDKPDARDRLEAALRRDLRHFLKGESGLVKVPKVG